MLGPKKGMGKRFIILAHSNYPFCKKTSGRWDELLKFHTINSFKHSSKIWIDLSPPFRTAKQF
jgi:hypothetical protein